MTLSPVFRSERAVRLLRDEGVWERLLPSLRSQARAVRTVRADLEELLAPRFRSDDMTVPEYLDPETPEGLAFLQEFFFLILFRSIFTELGVATGRLRLYEELNFSIKGTITAADNIFDDQAKRLLPIRAADGSRYMSILQLMCFERLLRRSLDRGVENGAIEAEKVTPVLRELLDRMASIGALEGSEEGGVDEIPTPDRMVEAVHRVRGGALFALAFAAPAVLESGPLAERLDAAEVAVARLGTAFQIVDDLTDFEFDVGRKSHNLLVSQIHHYGSDEEKAALQRIWGGEEVEAGMVEGLFAPSARAVLERAYVEARASFTALEKMGYWFPASLSESVVQAIVGMDGVARMALLTG